MSDFGDYISLSNSVSLQTLQESSKLSAERYELDKQGEYLREKFNVAPEGWVVFDKEHPERKPTPSTTRFVRGAGIGAVAGAAIGFFAGAGIGVVPGLLIGGTLTGLMSVFADEKPTIMQEQIEKYRAYLTTLEKDLDAGRTPSVPFHAVASAAPVAVAQPPHEVAAVGSESATRFRDSVAASRATTVPERSAR